MMPWSKLGLLCVTAAIAAACTSAEPETTASTEQAVAETLADTQPELLIKDPRSLVELEERGFAFSNVLGFEAPSYQRIVATMDRDLQRLRSKDSQSGVGVDFPHRQFDIRWLTAKETSRFELVAVVNRLDRISATDCGEVRLIYRLAYTLSRLPMTINVVYPQTGTCSEVASQWLTVKSAGGTPEALVAGPLAKLPPFKQVEINFQAVRWPSNERPEMGGHAEYILRVFRPSATEPGNVEPAPLENTPRSDLTPDEKTELRTWVDANRAEILEGTALVPEKFLATQALSVGPRGLARMANRLYAQLYPDLDPALIRRLDTMTCQGCHQARSIAGFHVLGEERDNAARMNALAIGRSPHLIEEMRWRGETLSAIAEGRTPTARPYAEHATNDGKFGAHCGLDETFASWTCATGLKCTKVHGGRVGMCLPANAPVGDVCETVQLSSNPDPHRDRVVNRQTLSCDQSGASARCNPVEQGFPDGMCRVDCTVGGVGAISQNAICGLIPSASGLTQCLAAHTPFAECLERDNTPTMLRTCDATTPCRDDYACSRVKNGPPGIGACMPPYFAFQARVDGHPTTP